MNEIPLVKELRMRGVYFSVVWSAGFFVYGVVAWIVYAYIWYLFFFVYMGVFVVESVNGIGRRKALNEKVRRTNEMTRTVNTLIRRDKAEAN